MGNLSRRVVSTVHPTPGRRWGSLMRHFSLIITHARGGDVALHAELMTGFIRPYWCCMNEIMPPVLFLARCFMMSKTRELLASHLGLQQLYESFLQTK